MSLTSRPSPHLGCCVNWRAHPGVSVRRTRGSHACWRAVLGGAPTIRIDNFGRVTEKYYRGAQPEGQDYADLAALGVKTVIDLTSEDSDPNEQRMTEQAGMRTSAFP